MIRKYQYITAIVLLLIFPVSAIGLNFSVHKCKHKGTIQFTFFETSNNNHSDNYCDVCDLKNSRKIKYHSNYHEAEKENDVDLCCGSNISEKEMEHTKSNCKSMNAEHQAIPEQNSNSQKENNNSEFNYLNTPCCSNSNVSYAIHFAFTNTDAKNYLNDLSLGSNILSHEKNHDKYFDNLLIKDINYPIKELIYNIILYIHFTSITGDDSDVPYLFFC